MKWRRLGDVGLWAALGLLVLAESGARNDPYWFRAACLAVLAIAILCRRRWPLTVLSVVVWTDILILAFTLNTSRGVPVALVPAISVLSYNAGRRETQPKHFVVVSMASLLGLLVLALTIRRGSQATEAVLTWLLLLLMALLIVVLPWLIGRYRAQQAQ
ncbi:MAG TPA: two-component sensor histidine kinase, partial [Kribbella sp.]|nr:two-component sensor histidine kinase [Kribbella sp.]